MSQSNSYTNKPDLHKYNFRQSIGKSEKEIARLSDEIDALINLKNKIRKGTDGEDYDMLNRAVSDLSRYIIVRCCGHLEYLLREIVLCHSKIRASDPIVKYIEKIDPSNRGAKPDADRINVIIELFSPEAVKAELLDYIGDSDNGSAIKSIISLRNKIAHGESESSTATKAKQYAQFTIDTSKKISQKIMG